MATHQVDGDSTSAECECDENIKSRGDKSGAWSVLKNVFNGMEKLRIVHYRARHFSPSESNFSPRAGRRQSIKRWIKSLTHNSPLHCFVFISFAMRRDEKCQDKKEVANFPSHLMLPRSRSIFKLFIGRIFSPKTHESHISSEPNSIATDTFMFRVTWKSEEKWKR